MLSLLQAFQQLRSGHVGQAKVQHHAVEGIFLRCRKRILSCRDNGHVNVVFNQQAWMPTCWAGSSSTTSSRLRRGVEYRRMRLIAPPTLHW